MDLAVLGTWDAQIAVRTSMRSSIARSFASECRTEQYFSLERRTASATACGEMPRPVTTCVSVIVVKRRG